MNEFKLKLLDYINKNYDNVVKSSKGGEYIEIDLIPNSHDGLHELPEILEYCGNNDIDVRMFMRSYPTNPGDGIRMGRYFLLHAKNDKRYIRRLKKFKLNKMEKEKWSEGLTPVLSKSDVIQSALNWWNELPAQDIYGDLGWANLCMYYFPKKTECYHFTEDEVLFMWEQENLRVK